MGEIWAESKEDYCLNMGMMDSYDYCVGWHPIMPDDKRGIEGWVEWIKDRWEDV